MFFLICFVFVVFFFVVNFVFVFVGVLFNCFVILIFFGIIPGGVVYILVGVGFGEVFVCGEILNFGIIFEF